MHSLLFALSVAPVLLASQRSGGAAVPAPGPAGEHTAMEKEHAAAFKDHRKWEGELMEMKARHKQAIATHRRLEADVLGHDAEIDRLLLKISQRRSEILAADAEIEIHEAGGAGEGYEEHAAERRAMEERHERMQRTVGRDAETHEVLKRRIEAIGSQRPQKRN